MMENKLEVHKDKTLKEAVEIAYKVSIIVLLAFNYIFSKVFIIVNSSISTCNHTDSPFKSLKHSWF